MTRPNLYKHHGEFILFKEREEFAFTHIKTKNVLLFKCWAVERFHMVEKLKPYGSGVADSDGIFIHSDEVCIYFGTHRPITMTSKVVLERSDYFDVRIMHDKAGDIWFR